MNELNIPRGRKTNPPTIEGMFKNINQKNMNDKQLLDQIAQALYSSRETQQNSYDLAKMVVEKNIKGDIIECGVAMAGNFASMILGATSLPQGKNRKFWGFDSFEGIQLAGKKDTVQAGIGEITHNTDVPYEELLVSSGITSHSKEAVVRNLQTWGLNNYNILLIEGWVQNSLPTVIDSIKEIAILRLDMDVYHPTKYTLDLLWDKISDGGVIIIDDWALDGVRTACSEFFQEKDINPVIHSIPNSTPTYFFK